MSDSQTAPSVPLREDDPVEQLRAEPTQEPKQPSDTNGKASNDSKQEESEVIEQLHDRIQSKESKESNESQPQVIAMREDMISQSPRDDFEEICSPKKPPVRSQGQLEYVGLSPSPVRVEDSPVLPENSGQSRSQQESGGSPLEVTRPIIATAPIQPIASAITVTQIPVSVAPIAETSSNELPVSNTLTSSQANPIISSTNDYEAASSGHTHEIATSPQEAGQPSYLDQSTRSIRLSDIDRESILRSHVRYTPLETSAGPRVEQQHREHPLCYCVLI